MNALKSKIAALALTASISMSGVVCAQEKPAAYGSIEDYPVPESRGTGAELDYCYRYSKRIWELVMGQPRNAATLERLSKVVAGALGSQGAAEDTAEIKKYFSGRYKTKEEMAGARFYDCGVRLKLPIEEKHRRYAELCFTALNLPAYAAASKSNSRTSAQVQKALKSSNPPSRHASIEKIVDLVYSKTSDEDVDGLLKDTFLACLVQPDANRPAK